MKVKTRIKAGQAPHLPPHPVRWGLSSAWSVLRNCVGYALLVNSLDVLILSLAAQAATILATHPCVRRQLHCSSCCLCCFSLLPHSHCNQFVLVIKVSVPRRIQFSINFWNFIAVISSGSVQFKIISLVNDCTVIFLSLCSTHTSYDGWLFFNP